MRTVGQILKEERERKIYTLDEVEKATKIRKDFLIFLEKDEFSKLPPTTFVQGFIKNYGKFLGLDAEKLLAIYRREFSDAKHPPRILESFSNPIDAKKFKITPAKFIGSVVFILVLVFFGYLWFEYKFLIDAPYLEVSTPLDQQSVQEESILISGRTDPEARVSINEQDIEVSVEGKFSQEIKLSDNVNNLVISSTSKSGKVTKIERTVILKR